ncbi:ATP-binding protein [Amycolatopsis thailandensis]|uniref:ATP-binding protein n=1 Tax=Amycolatopsis thailandensis TaxID=589330 RepID=UPI0037B5C2C3
MSVASSAVSSDPRIGAGLVPGVGNHPALIAAVSGVGGIGKTWLALAWAYQRLSWFPDGQLFVDLRGFSPDSEPLNPAVAVRGFLDVLGVQPGSIPVDLSAQTGLFRSLVAGKRMLIVLDNAADAEQVAPLLPGGDSCAVLVTSRRTLTGLITRRGAQHLSVDTLDEDDAHTLLARRAGAERADAEPTAVAELVSLCGGLPLALGIIAGRAHAHPHVPLAEFAAELRDLGISALEDEDTTVSLPAVLSWSYRALAREQQAAFGLLGIAPGPDIGVHAAANLVGLPLMQAGRLLRVLEEASLLHRGAHGRYSMHDLVRRYATDAAHHQLTTSARTVALRRLLGFYRFTAEAACRLMYPERPPLQTDASETSYAPYVLSDAAAGLDWFASEHACLLAAQRTAAVHGWHYEVWHLAHTLHAFHYRRGNRRDELIIWEAGAAATEHLLDPSVRIHASRSLGRAYAELGRHDEAIDHLEQALTLAEQQRDRLGQAAIHRAFGRAWELRGDNQRALTHASGALDLSRSLDDPLGQAHAHNQIARFAARLGQFERARRHCEAALGLDRKLGHLLGEAAILYNLGYIAYNTGHYGLAVEHYSDALTARRNLGHTYHVADTLYGLGQSYAVLGEHAQARTIWREALELYQAQRRDTEVADVTRQLDALHLTDTTPGNGSQHDCTSTP